MTLLQEVSKANNVRVSEGLHPYASYFHINVSHVTDKQIG